MSETSGGASRRLERELRHRVRGGVRFDPGTRAMYSTDASNYRQVPIGVVTPRDPEDAVAALGVCRELEAPVLSRGGGTSLAGECCNVAVVLDWSRHANRIESIDAAARTAIVQPGIVLDELNAAAGRDGLVFGPRPATHDHCTIGGMIGNNSCGSTAQWSGTTGQNVNRLEVMTYDGVRMWTGATGDDRFDEVVAAGGGEAGIYRNLRALRDRCAARVRERFPDIPRRISGFNLDDLLPERGFHVARALTGSEATCVTVLRAELNLLPRPRETTVVLLTFADVIAAAAAVPMVNRHDPMCVECLDERLVEFQKRKHLNPKALRLLPDGGAWLLVQLGGDDPGELENRAADLVADARGMARSAEVVADAERRQELWHVRESGLGATARVPDMADTAPGWEDSAVAPDNLADYLRDFRELLREHRMDGAALYGHFGHGCLHCRLPFDLSTSRGVSDYRRFAEEAADLVAAHGGSLSGEHGDGQARGELLDRMFGDVVDDFREFKRIFDPAGRMNPGKVVDPRPLDGDLRWGPDYAPAHPETAFRYPHDAGLLSRATERCVGVGKCRHGSGGVMCPSYMVTGEERHSTRGRARLLNEMLRGDVITDGWRSAEVREALDLCLACKGCKTDCPINVDMATYKAEFLDHHYSGRIRPLSHYSLGWLPLWSRIAAKAPRLANAAVRAPAVGRLAKLAAGLDPRRDLPRFAARRFSDWYRRRGPREDRGSGTVVLWPDTFTDNFAPHIAAAALRSLESLGFRVIIPPRPVCCGLTWISTGQLERARRVQRRTVSTLAPLLRGDTPLVGLEPSCLAALRADATELNGQTDDFEALASRTYTLAELLRTNDIPVPSIRDAPADAIVQTHCHQHAVMGFDDDVAVLRDLGVEPRVLDSGCCGMAGDFGMTKAHREVSLACAERVLLPEVRDAPGSTLVLADGFSCRTQIADAHTGRDAAHLAQVLEAAVAGGDRGDRPERDLLGGERRESWA